MGVARDLGYLKVPENTLIDVRTIDDFRPDQVVLISTGSQGEPLSALARIANREHPAIKLEPGDTVVLASSMVPGNENAVFRVINGLTKLGARVVHRGNALVHTSGHASAGELLYVYNLLRPRNVMPVHGEVRHLMANADLAVSTGLPRENTVIAEDGTVVDLARHRAKVVGQIECDYIFVDGSTVGDISESSLTDRRILGEEGFISVVVVVNLRSKEVLSGPVINDRGFLEDPSVYESVQTRIAGALNDSLRDGVDDTHRLQQVIRRQLGKWVSDTYRPVVVSV
jgi:ribonuclease J